MDKKKLKEEIDTRVLIRMGLGVCLFFGGVGLLVVSARINETTFMPWIGFFISMSGLPIIFSPFGSEDMKQIIKESKDHLRHN